MKHKDFQTWKLPFYLKGLKIEHGHTFKTQEDDAVIVLDTSDENRTYGEIVFRLPESPHCEDDSRCATGIGKANIESVFRYDFVISASIDTDPIEIECDEKALYTDERLIDKYEIVRVKPISKPEVSFTVKEITYPNDMDLKRFLSFLEKLKKHHEKQTLDRCKEWFKKGMQEGDAVNKFIMYWIAFNSLYSLSNTNKSDEHDINKLFNNCPKDVNVIIKIFDIHDEIINLLCQKNLTNRHGTKNYSDDLKKSLSVSQINRKTMRELSLCLWRVRNDVFHGGNMPEDEKIFIGKCASLLKDIVRSMMYSYVTE